MPRVAGPRLRKPSTKAARRLRLNSTDAEKRLWTHLRSGGLDGVRFRRQSPIGSYIVDFVSLERRLVIEVDGGQHATDQARDAMRTRWLETQGFHVLRFWNNDVLENTEGVLTAIRLVLGRQRPPPHPSPTRGEGV